MSETLNFGNGIIYDPSSDKFQYQDDLNELNLNRPLTGVIELLYACNLSCNFCMKSDEDNKRIPSYKNTQFYLSKLSPKGLSFRTVISGGEPFLRKDIEKLLEYGHQIGHVQNVVTNGILINPNRSLVELVNLFEIGLDGSTPEIYQGIRGVDEFNKVTENIQKLTELDGNVRITYLLNQKNFMDAKKMPKLCSELGVSKLRLQRFIKYGRGITNYKDFELSDEQIEHAVKTTKEEAISLGIDLRTPTTQKFYSGTIFITPFGDIIYRDGNGNQDTTIKLGNLKNQEISKIWTPEMSLAHKKTIISPKRV